MPKRFRGRNPGKLGRVVTAQVPFSDILTTELVKLTIWVPYVVFRYVGAEVFSLEVVGGFL